MDKKNQTVDIKYSELSVKELEARLKSRPNDIGLKARLALALIDRHLYGDVGHSAGNRADIKRIRKLVRDWPDDKISYPRAYLAYLDGKEEEFIKWLVEFAREFGQDDEVLFNSDKLLDRLIIPFANASPELWNRLVDALSQYWPESAAVLTLKGETKLSDENNPGEAIDYLVRALEKDENYWLAAWWCASAYYQDCNWRSARNYYRKALRSELAQVMPEIHFDLAWCLGKIKDYEEEERHYRSCLELDPDYPNARNDLGWSLYKQGKYEEALEVFEEAIKRGNDGKYPLRNKARVLEKLDCLPEAIETLKQDIYRGELTKSAQQEIARLEEIIAKKEMGQAVPTPGTDDDEEEGAASNGSDQPDEEPKSRQPARQKSKIGIRGRSRQVPSEEWLERMLEDMISKENKAFGRKLQMFDHPEENYGRQFAIPDVGRIDLLAEDIETDDLIVIELKKGASDDQVVGQISRYMTWVRENLIRGDQEVLGIVCVYHASRNLQLSARNIPGLEVFEYGLTLQRVC